MADVPDTWTSPDFPALRVIARWHVTVASDRPPHLTPDHVARELGREDGDVEVRGALTRLLDGGYIRGSGMPDEPFDYVIVTGVTERGLRAAGAWPSEDRFLEVLTSSLERVADSLEEQGEPEKAGRVRGVIASLIDVARTVGIDWLEKYLAHRAGLQ